ncbi:MAG TPA: histidine kinase dimerization/phospho-acceptor domain-containing protein [Planctomycetota bacterium]|nr:histidine kinase dimerization/phospho-acceptor domain-containing protein [Planctomycetota bacterium]
MPGYHASVLVCCEPNSGLESIVPQLRTRNYRVMHAPTLYRAVSMHSGEPADAVIVDANNFGEKDYELFDIFRESLPGVKLFATVSMTRRDRTPILLKCGVDGYFFEPFYADEIVGALERALQPKTEPETQISQADKLEALGRFARGVAHEVNNPLATLSGWVQIFLSEIEEKDPKHETLEVMQQELDRIAKVVQDLLAFSGQPSPQRDEVDINALIRGLIRNKERADVEYLTHFDSTLPKVYANQQQFGQALAHILNFSRSHMKGKGTIDITTKADASEGVLIVMRDTQARVNDDILNGLFDPFGSSNGDGTEAGLGLSVSYGIIKGLGGSLRADRDPRGLVFTVTVPAATQFMQQGA